MIQRIDGKLIRVRQEALTKLQAQRQKEKQQLAYKEAAQKREAELNKIAREIEQEIRNTNFTSIKQFNDYINSLPVEIRKRIHINDSFLRQTREDAIKRAEYMVKTIKKWIKEEDRYDREKRYKGMLEVWKDYLNKLKKNSDIVYRKEDIEKLAKAKGKEWELQAKAKLRAKEARKKAKEEANALEQALKTGNVKKIKYEAGTGLVKSITTKEGKTFDLSKYDVNTRKSADIFGQGSILAKQNKDIEKLKQENIKTFEKEMNNVLSGKKPDINLLKKGKITADQYTTLVRAYETKIKPVQFKTPKDAQRALKSADDWTKEVAFKSLVNYNIRELNKQGIKDIKPLSFKEDISKFVKTNEKVNKKIEELKKKAEKVKKAISKKAQEDIISQLKQKSLSIEERIRTGQTVSPKEYQEYNRIVTKNLDKLTKEQLQGLKAFVLSPVNYGRSLVIRRQKGEKNPLFNDIKSFGKGLYKGGVEPLIELTKLSYKGLKGSVRISYEYGKRLAREAQKGKFVLDDDIKKLTNTIIKGAKTVYDKEEKIRKYVKDHPTEAAMLAGLATVRLAEKGIKKTYSSFQKDPAMFLGEALGFIIGQDIVLKGVKRAVTTTRKLSPYYVNVEEWLGKTAQEMGTSKKLIQRYYGKKVSLYHTTPAKIKELFKKNLLEVKVTGGKGLDRKYYWAQKYLPELEFKLGGKQKYTEKQIIQKLKKLGFTEKQIQKNVKLYSEDHLYFGNDKIYSYYLDPKKGGNIVMVRDIKVAKFPKTIENRIKNIDKLTEKERVKLRADINKYIKKHPDKFFLSPRTLSKGFGEFEVVLPVKSKLAKISNLRSKAYKFLGVDAGTEFTYINRIDDFVEIQEAVIGDKLNDKILKKGLKDFKDRLKKKFSKKKLKEEIKKWFKENFTKEGKLIKKKRLEKIKKLEKELIREGRIEIRPKKKAIKRVIKRKISKKKVTKRALKKVVKRKIKAIERPKKRVKKKEARKITVKRTPKIEIKVRPIKSRVKKVKVKKVTPRITTKPVLREVPRIPKKPVTKVPEIPSKLIKIKLTTNYKPKQQKQPVFDIRYRERKNKSLPFHPKNNPVVIKIKRIGLPLNSAFMKGATIVDNSLIRSFELIPVGVKSVKDRKINSNLLKKFTLSKSKKVLKFIEKKKYVRDTKGEKRELKRVKKK